MQHVPYHGAAAALTDVMGGRIDITIVDAVPPQYRTSRLEKLRPITVMCLVCGSGSTLCRRPWRKRVYRGFDLGAWCGLVVPAGTPSHVIAKLNKAINVVLTDPALRDAMAKLSFATRRNPTRLRRSRELIARRNQTGGTKFYVRGISSRFTERLYLVLSALSGRIITEYQTPAAHDRLALRYRLIAGPNCRMGKKTSTIFAHHFLEIE